MTCDLAESVGGGTATPSPSPGAGWDVGAGQCNGDFTVVRNAGFPGTAGGSGIELGLRIEQRSVGQLNPFAHTGAVYTVQTGADPTNAARAWWNFQQSIAYDGNIDDLDALTFIIRTDAGTSVPGAASFDMLALRGVIDDRHAPKSTTTFSDIYQTSQNPLFAPWFSTYDMNEEGAWTLALVAEKGGKVSSVSICVRTPNASCDNAPVLFRALRGDVQPGLDLCNTGHLALNFRGGAGPAGGSWIAVPHPPDATLGPPMTLNADICIHPYNNKKGIGLLALFNQGLKGLALVVYDNGNTDTLALALVDGDPAGKFTLTLLQNVKKDPPLPRSTWPLCLDQYGTSSVGEAGTPYALSHCFAKRAGIKGNAWYRVTMDLTRIGDELTVTGTVRTHTNPSDPDSSLDAEVFKLPFDDQTFTYSLSGLGLLDVGEVGITASAFSAKIDSSLTNFATPAPAE